MKHVSKFLNEAPLWQVYLVFLILMMAFWSVAVYVMSPQEYNPTRFLIGVFCLAASTAGFSWSMILVARHSNRFWEEARNVQELAHKAKTTEELADIWNNQFLKLKKMSMGGPHIAEVARVGSIIRTAYRIYKEREEEKTLST